MNREETNESFENDSSDETEQDDFYFESDHVALRGNKDYSAVLRTIAILQAQMVQATKDIDKIGAAEAKALEDPESFIKQLANGEKIDIPGSINIIEIPKINFEKYEVKIPDFPIHTSQSSANDITVRGNVFEEKKPVSHKQLWTTEEQIRLEELLIEFPPEPIEMKRFAKIARALGNRTTTQVASRIQKYFKKLHSHGLPIPGRSPKSHKPTIPKSLKYFRQTLKPSTFFPAQDVPVKMTEEEDDDIYGVSLDANFYKKFHVGLPNSKDSARMIVVNQLSSETSDTTEMRIMKLLGQIKNDKETYDGVYSEHAGYKCNLCSEEPIIGTRWNCSTCSDLDSLDYCSDCLVTQLMHPGTSHPIQHCVIAYRHITDDNPLSSQNDSEEESSISEAELNSEENSNSNTQVFDKDYLLQNFSKSDKYNYLDPNFLPK